jgi:hypothetical protein
MEAPSLGLKCRKLTNNKGKKKSNERVLFVAFTKVCSKFIVKPLWLLVVFNFRQDGIQKLKKEKKHFTANGRVVALALSDAAKQPPS